MRNISGILSCLIAYVAFMTAGFLTADTFGAGLIPNEGVWPILGAVFVPGLLLLVGIIFNLRHFIKSWSTLNWLQRMINTASILVALVGLGVIIFIGIAGSNSS